MQHRALPSEPGHRWEIWGVVLLAFAVLAAVSLYLETGGRLLQYSTDRSIGATGQALNQLLTMLAGKGRFLVPVLLGGFGLNLVLLNRNPTFGSRFWGVIVEYMVILTYLHLPLVSTGLPPGEAIRLGYWGEGGGVIGALVSIATWSALGRWGSYIFLLAVAFIGFILATNLSATRFFSLITRGLGVLASTLVASLGTFLFTEDDRVAEEAAEPPDASSLDKKARNRSREKRTDVQNNKMVQQVAKKQAPSIQIYPEPTVLAQPAGESNLPKIDENRIDKNRAWPQGSEINGANRFILPPLNLLEKAVRMRSSKVAKDISEKVKLLEDTMESFGVKAQVIQVSCGPAITRYEVQPAPGVKVSKIVSLADDIALSMAASDVRIEAPIPGKAAVGIEVPNKDVSVVHLREVLESLEFREANSVLTVALGKDIAGQAVVADLAQMPHLLIAGATGSGKSVCLNSLVSSLLFRCKPDQLKFLMIDPKMVELTTYNGIPHLLAPVVTDPKKAAAALRWMVSEMEKRYGLFAEAGMRDISRYNLMLFQEEASPSDFLPYIVVIIDELADLMMVAPADVEDSICRLAQMARAAGIHLVVATQRPSVDVITGIIKANIPSRIAFAVSSMMDSRTILDTGGAEKLLGRGDMLFTPVGASKPIRVQGVYLSDREVESLTAFLRAQEEPQFADDLIRTSTGGLPQVANEDDELLPDATKILLENGQASISMLQRRLRIGYTRAARLIDLMEKKGIVGRYEGSKARAILINQEQYRKLFGERISQ